MLWALTKDITVWPTGADAKSLTNVNASCQSRSQTGRSNIIRRDACTAKFATRFTQDLQPSAPYASDAHHTTFGDDNAAKALITKRSEASFTEISRNGGAKRTLR